MKILIRNKNFVTLRLLILFLIFFSMYISYYTYFANGQSQENPFFEYTLNKNVDNGYGVYDGYKDSLSSQGHYSFIINSSLQQTVHAEYSWSYYSNQGENKQGSVDREVQFNKETRKYSNFKTDLDDYDTINGTTLSIWFSIPTTVKVGDFVSILENVYEVKELDKVIAFNGNYVHAIELYSSGNGFRNDDYGIFSYNFESWYYFDKNSGFINSENYIEHDIGTYQGMSGGFSLSENFSITKSSYSLNFDQIRFIFELLIKIVSILIFIVLVIGTIVLYPKLRWKTKVFVSTKYGEVIMNRVWSLDQLSYETQEVTKYFDHFIQDFISKAFFGNDTVVQVVKDKHLIGLGFYNKEAEIGTIFTLQEDVKIKIQNYLRVHDFFTEFQQKNKPNPTNFSIIDPVSKLLGFKLLDIYQVLTLNLTENYFFDTSIIRDMRDSDLLIIANMSEKVNGIKSKDWINSQFFSGDIGIVAEINNNIIGFAFASFNENYGRLHSLTVLPEFRNRGFGKELMNGRLKILYELGITHVITEIANWNLASLQIAYSHGFVKIGELFIEIDRSSPRNKKIVRF